LETWSRRDHCEFFSTWGFPYFNLTANVDLTAFYPFVKHNNLSLNLATIYVIARGANAVPEFRQRIRENSVVEHDVVHPSSTVLLDNDLFSFCPLEYVEDFSEFAAKAAQRIARVKARIELADVHGQDDMLYMTAIPWVAFTSFMHPLELNQTDSVPRFAWGKFFKVSDSWLMPLNVQVHHALINGLHVGRFFTAVQEYLLQPESVLGKQRSVA